MCEPLTERICECCGKAFVPAPYHKYKILWRGKTYIYCSYHCWVADDISKRAKAKRGGKKPRKVEQLQLDGSLIKLFDSITASSNETGIDYKAIERCCASGGGVLRGFIFRFKQ